MELRCHTFLTPALDKGEWSHSHSSCFRSGRTPATVIEKAERTDLRIVARRKILPLLEIELWPSSPLLIEISQLLVYNQFAY
jgi:hypothetical protein